MSVAPYPSRHDNYDSPTMMQTPYTYDNSPETPPSKTPIIKYTYIREDNGTISVYHQPTNVLMYHISTPSPNKPHVSIVDKHTFDAIWNAKVSSAADVYGADGSKVRPTANWECTNIKGNYADSKTLIKFDKSLKGYVCTWNGRVFLWKLYGTGGDIYCVEGLSGIGGRVAQFEDKSNTLMIDLSRRFANANNYNSYESNSAEDSLKSFETFILMTGLIAKNSAKKLQSAVNRMSNNFPDAHLFNYTGLFLFCGLCGTY